MYLILLLALAAQPHTHVDTSCVPIHMIEFDDVNLVREYSVCWNVWMKTYHEEYILKCSFNGNAMMFINKRNSRVSVTPLVNNMGLTCK